MPTQTTPNLVLIFQALAGGGGLMGAVLFLRDAVVSAEKKRREAADKDKSDSSVVEVAKLHEAGEGNRRAEEMAWKLAEERKLDLASVKSEQCAMRVEFEAKLLEMRKEQAKETERSALAQVSANAAIDLANEAHTKLEAAKVLRDEISEKLRLVEIRAAKAENRTEQIEREKNIEIENLREQLRDANHNIEVLQAYIREHKMTVSIAQDGQTITASIEPPKSDTLNGPPDHDADFA